MLLSFSRSYAQLHPHQRAHGRSAIDAPAKYKPPFPQGLSGRHLQIPVAQARSRLFTYFCTLLSPLTVLIYFSEYFYSFGLSNTLGYIPFI